MPFEFKSMKLRLVTFLLAVALVPLFVVGYIANNKSERTLEESISGNMLTVARSTMDKIDRNLFERYGDVQAFSLNTLTVQQLSVGGQMNQLQQFVNTMMTTYGIYDLMILVDVNGKPVVVNTADNVGKELNTRALLAKNFSRAEWFVQCVSGGIAVAQSYFNDPTIDEDVATVYGQQRAIMNYASPVRSANGKIIGVWCNFASFERIVRQITNETRDDVRKQGISTFGITLVSKDGLLLDTDESAKPLNDNLKGKLQSVDKGLKGEQGCVAEEIQKGTEELIAFTQSKGALGYSANKWVILAHSHFDEAMSSAADLRNMSLIFTLIAASVIVFIGFTVSNSITKPIKEVITKIDNADVNSHLNSKRKDELGDLQRAFDRFVGSIRETILHVAEASASVASASSEISSSTEEMAAGSAEQTQQSSEVAGSVSELTKTIADNAHNASTTAATAQQARLAAENGGRTVQETVSGMKRIAEVVSKSAATVQELGKSSESIGAIISVIDDIADQTNLLALNAAIEAARAGEQGRGFAVVADEVRRLAERTTKATKEIADMIKKIQGDTHGAVASMREGTKQVNEGIALADKAGQSLQEIVHLSHQVTEMITGIAAASEEQSSSSEQISSNITAITNITNETAAATQQIARSAEDLNRLTENLQRLVERFNIGESGKQRSATPSMRRGATHTTIVPKAETAVNNNGALIDNYH